MNLSVKSPNDRFQYRAYGRICRKRLMDLENFEGLLITAISRNGEIIIPNGSTELMANDMIYVIGKLQIFKI